MEEQNGKKVVIASALDIDLGVEQRIAGSDAEKERIHNVLRRMHKYFEEEILSLSQYEHVRGRWSVLVIICFLRNLCGDYQ